MILTGKNSMELKKIGSLQIEPEAASQSTLFWTIQKIVFVILVILLVGVALGLAGPGILDKKTITNDGQSLQVNYDIFSRKMASNTLEVKVASHKKNTQLWFSTDYIRNQYIKQIIPAPISSQMIKNKIIFNFLLEGDDNIVTFFFEPQIAGFIKTNIGINDEPSVNITQFFYP
jgi:hypothetical protein